MGCGGMWDKSDAGFSAVRIDHHCDVTVQIFWNAVAGVRFPCAGCSWRRCYRVVRNGVDAVLLTLDAS